MKQRRWMTMILLVVLICLLAPYRAVFAGERIVEFNVPGCG